jgi:cytochrome P450
MDRPAIAASIESGPLPEGRPEHLHDLFHDSVACLRRLQQTYGPLVQFRKEGARTVFAFGVDANHILLNRTDVYHLHSFFPGPKRSAQRRLNTGLFNLNGDKHRHHRRLIMPLFARQALPAYHEFLTDLTDRMLMDWRPRRSFDLLAEIKGLALRITTQVLFGLPDFALGETIDHLFEHWLELNHIVSFGTVLPLEPPADAYQEMVATAEEMERLIRALVAERAALPDGADVMTLILQARRAGAMDDVDVIGEATHLFNAAYHTTTYALSWILFLLAQHPDVAERVRDELAGARSGETPYLERVIKEGMRILPPVVYYARVAEAAVEFGAYHLPRGTLFIGSHYVTHHMTELYAEPERFDPDRWLTETPGPSGYIPFGGGARMCVGAPFALMALKTCLSRIVPHCRLAVVPGARVDRKCNLTLGPRHGIPVVVQPRGVLGATSQVYGDIHESVSFPEIHATSSAA